MNVKSTVFWNIISYSLRATVWRFHQYYVLNLSEAIHHFECINIPYQLVEPHSFLGVCVGPCRVLWWQYYTSQSWAVPFLISFSPTFLMLVSDFEREG
jgi:hypothetical protein